MDQDAATPTLDAPTDLGSTLAPTPAPGAGAEAEAPAPRPLRAPATPDKGGFVWGTGRRKSSVARVRVRPAKDAEAKFHVNGKPVEDFFSEPQHRSDCTRALEATGTRGKLDVFVNVTGGGITGQSGAILLGVARALIGYDPALEQTLRDNGYTTRDPREVERKKYGQRGARRRFQFSKR
ncbi:MAG: 30S ribosomal protein S9 [Planctomycetota bacterium]